MSSNKFHYLENLINYLSLNGKQFATSIGLDRPDRIYHVIQGRNRISPDLAKRILQKYPEVNSSWLLTGEGEMLKNTITDEDTGVVPHDNYTSLINSYALIAQAYEKTVSIGDNISETNKLLAYSNSELVKQLAELMDQLRELRAESAEMYRKNKSKPLTISDRKDTYKKDK